MVFFGLLLFSLPSLIAWCSSFFFLFFFYFGVAELGWLLSVRMMWLYPSVHLLRRAVFFFIIDKIVSYVISTEASLDEERRYF